MTYPEDLVNRALDVLGVEAIGDLQEGTPAAKAASRQYVPLRQQLLRAAHWTFARKQINLDLVQDSTAGDRVPGGFRYEYLQPSDCLKVRFVPAQSAGFVDFTTYSATPVVAGIATVTPAAMSGTISDAQWAITSGTFLTILDGDNTENVKVTGASGTTFTATFLYSHPNPFDIIGRVAANNSTNTVNPIPQIGQTQIFQRFGMSPAPFVVATDTVTSQWGISDFGDAQYGFGSPATVILTNVRAAQLVYTADINDPDEWNSTFQEGFVATLAAKIAMTVVEDKKFAMELRREQIGIAKMMLREARAENGNETWTSIDLEASWTRARSAWSVPFIGSDYGGYVNSWDTFAFADGSTL